MIAEIIAIGSEIVSGAKLDTNSQWLSRELGDRGITVRFHTSVADDLAANVQAVRIAAERTDLVLITGGLGPTLDDLTRVALAEAGGVPLVLHAESLARIEEMFRSRGRPMPDRNRVQAEFPAGSQPLANPIGTAPGIWMELPRPNGEPTRIAALPGVPSEMKRMYSEQVAPRLPSATVCIRHRLVHCFGCGESQAEELLGELTARGREPEIGITAHEATITLRIQARAATESECQRGLDGAAAEIRRRLGRFVFGGDDDELEDVVFEALRRRSGTLAILDCGTAGWLGRVTAEAARRCPGAFRGCATFARAADALRWLAPQSRGALEPPDAELLASACRQGLQTTYALAVAELPDLAGDELAATERRAMVALAAPQGVRAVSVALGGNPAILSARLGKTALDLLRLELDDAV
ncbi:MAG: damage-inducible protein CinA [Planctomyces sp.]|nr:damage-inducible protein CinA [Planctomyces sp.]